MKYFVFETNGSGAERYSRTEEVEADTAIQAVTVYESTFNLRPQTTHLMVTSEGKGTGVVLFVKEATSQTRALAGKGKVQADGSPWLSNHITTQGGEVSSSDKIERCGWSRFFFILGLLNLVIAFFAVTWALGSRTRDDVQMALYLMISGVVSGLASFLTAYLVQLLFECRNYLRKMAGK